MTDETPSGFHHVQALDAGGEIRLTAADDESILAAANAIRKARRGEEGNPITRWSNRYATVFQEGAEALAGAKELSSSALRTLFALMARAPYDGEEFPAQPEKVRAMTGVSQPRHSEAVRRLLDIGVIERPRHGWLRFNPEFVWRGSAQSREVALAEKIAGATGAERRG